MRKSLVGDYRPEHIFTLKQSQTAYRYYQQLIADCDREIQERIVRFQNQYTDPSATAESPKESPATKDSTFDLGSHGWGNQEEQAYTDRPENVRVEDGMLIIDLVREIPEAMKPKKIHVGTQKSLSVVKDDKDASAAA